MNTSAKIRERITELESELKKLRVALEVCEEFDDPPAGNSPRSASELARQILKAAHGGPMHYKDVYMRAVELGFPGKETSMRRTMSKMEDVFERAGDGAYRLKKKDS